MCSLNGCILITPVHVDLKDPAPKHVWSRPGYLCRVKKIGFY